MMMGSVVEQSVGSRFVNVSLGQAKKHKENLWSGELAKAGARFPAAYLLDEADRRN